MNSTTNQTAGTNPATDLQAIYERNAKCMCATGQLLGIELALMSVSAPLHALTHGGQAAKYVIEHVRFLLEMGDQAIANMEAAGEKPAMIAVHREGHEARKKRLESYIRELLMLANIKEDAA
jgi:hypothetical protein